MKKFSFQLQALLDHRQRIEDEKKKELAKVNTLLSRERNRLNDFENVFKATQISLQVKERGRINIPEVLFYQSYLIQLRQVINHQLRNIQQIVTVVERKRKELVESSKNRKVMERLKEKAYEKYVKDITTFEQKFIDDIAISKFIREGSFNFKQLDN